MAKPSIRFLTLGATLGALLAGCSSAIAPGSSVDADAVDAGARDAAVDARAVGGDAPDAVDSGDAEGPLRFTRDIAPILAARCMPCHTWTRESLLETSAYCFEGPDFEPAARVVPGEPNRSGLMFVFGDRPAGLTCTAGAMPKMPDGSAGVGLNIDAPEEAARIRAWVAEGARD